MKVHYFNDRRVDVLVKVQSWGGVIEEVLKARSGKEFDVWIPRGQVLYIKETDYSEVTLASTERVKENDT